MASDRTSSDKPRTPKRFVTVREIHDLANAGTRELVTGANVVITDAAREAAAEGADPIVIVARTDARATHGLDEAISRAKLFREIGANWRFVEARPLIASDGL